jgi:hypothetical protein
MNFSLNAQPFADHEDRAILNLGEIAARFLLQQDRSDENPQVG